jgi:hypothetical protein
MYYFIWSVATSAIFTMMCRRFFRFIPGSMIMLFVVNLSGSLIVTSSVGLGPNFWQERVFCLPAVGTIFAGNLLYLLLWYVACLTLATEDMA